MHCETAGAKSLIRSYVDAGHDVLCAENIYAALYYGNDMKNSAIALAQAEEKSTFGIKKSSKITQYHSFEFHDTHRVVCRYFGISQGV